MFAHNRSFELRLKSAEENLSRAASEEEKEVKQRRWLTRRIETRQRLGGPRVSDQTKTEQNISKLAQSNKIAVHHSEPKPVRPSSSNAGEFSHPIPEPMATSYLRYNFQSGNYILFNYKMFSSEFEDDSGIFTSSFYSEHSDTVSIRLSQSFGKSFPDILEDCETSQSHSQTKTEKAVKSVFGSVPSDTPPVKPKRSMIVNHCKLLARENQPPSVRDRVKQFESIAHTRTEPRDNVITTKTGKTSTTSKITNRGNHTKSSVTKTIKQCEPSDPGDLSACSSQKNSSQLTSTPGPVMSISSSSSASCGYKDFLIDDDYVDQPQLLLSRSVENKILSTNFLSGFRNDEKNAKDLDETLVEKLDSYLADSKEENEAEADKSEDDCSVREILQQSEMDEKSADATYGTLSDQDSIHSEADCIFTNQQDAKQVSRNKYFIFILIFYLISFHLMTNANQDDILQDVLDMNALLSKLKTILLEVSY